MTEHEGNVIDLKSRKPFAQARAEEAKRKRQAARQRRKSENDAVMEHRECVIDALEGVLTMVRAGKLEGLILIAREPKSKLFLTELVLDERVVLPNDLHAFVGIMETLKLELADSAAATAPALLVGGQVLDPTTIPDDEEWGDE